MLELIPAGLANGAIYGLLAVGMVLIFRATAILNLAHGEFLVVGAYIYSFAVEDWGVGPMVQLLFVLIGGAVIGVLFFGITHLLMSRAPLELQSFEQSAPTATSRHPMTVIIGTLALSIVMVNLFRLAFTDTASAVPVWLVGDTVLEFGETQIAGSSLLIVVVALLATLGLYLWFRYSSTGRAVRAVAESQEYAALSGIRVRRLLATTWAVSGAFASLSGLLVSSVVFVYPTMGEDVLFKGVVAAILGGFDSIAGAMIGGLSLGVLEILGTSAVGANIRDVWVFGLMLLFLLLRPDGIFGAKARRTV